MEEYDQVELKSLALPQSILAPSPWTHFQPSGTISRETTVKLRWQPQPGTVSINLSLMPPAFVTVARGDVLDGNTMHYGILAKSIRAKLAADQIEELDIYSVFESVTELVHEQCRLIGPDRQSNSLAPIRKMMVQLEFPRAGMFAKELRLGEETDFTRSSETPGHRAWFELCELRMEVLIGVNDYERAAPQPVIAQVSCHWNGKAAGLLGEGDFVFRFEATILEIVRDTRFETLESLILYLFQELQTRLLGGTLLGGTRANGWLKIRLAKPRAVVFAEEPAVEIVRKIQLQ